MSQELESLKLHCCLLMFGLARNSFMSQNYRSSPGTQNLEVQVLITRLNSSFLNKCLSNRFVYYIPRIVLYTGNAVLQNKWNLYNHKVYIQINDKKKLTNEMLFGYKME